jgi:hypothetical protein
METSRHAHLQPTIAPTTEEIQPPPDLPDYPIETEVDASGAIFMMYDRQAIVPQNALCCEFTLAGHPPRSTIHLSLPLHWLLEDLQPGGLIWTQIDEQHWNCLVGRKQMSAVVNSGVTFTSTWRFVPPTGGLGFDARVTIKRRPSQEP